MSANARRLIAALTFYVWLSIVTVAFYVVQKPVHLDAVIGLLDTIWTLVVLILIGSNALGFGHALIQNLGKDNTSATERILLGFGLGLGLMGLLGLCFGALGITNPYLIISVQVGMMILLIGAGGWRRVYADLITIKSRWSHYQMDIHPFTKAVFSLTFLFAFLLAVTPPIEAFDALSYHLTAPLRILEDGGIRPYDVYAFWHPGLVEADFFWGLGLGSDRFPQFLHGLWAVLGILLIAYWGNSGWNITTAQKAVLVILSMPSLYRLASWAYTDLALVFYTIAALYAIVKWLGQAGNKSPFWLLTAGVMTGLAMGIKYTSFILPIGLIIIVIIYCRKSFLLTLKTILLFGFVVGLVAIPWYLRNWIVMENPIYPFIFGGKYWDSFRMSFYGNPGSGIGWNIVDLLLLPLNATLGHHDSTYYGGRIGPLFLIFSPITLYMVLKNKQSTDQQRHTIVSISIFFLLSLLSWVVGVVNYDHLWQTRLLYPAMFLFSIPTALGWQGVMNFDTSKLRISFVANLIVGLMIVLTLIEAGYNVVSRNPLAYAMGLETRQSYLEKVQPGYAEAMQMLNQTPPEAYVYFLFEPRGYYSNRETQPDLILDNLAHDLYKFNSQDRILNFWENQGYTHVLVYRKGFDFLLETNPQQYTIEHQEMFDMIVENSLIMMDKTSDDAYELYKIIPNK